MRNGPAAPPRLRLMQGLDLDEHPRRLLRDAVLAVLFFVAFALVVHLLAP